MKIVVAAVGKPRDAALAAATRQFEDRAARYWPLVFVEVKEESARGTTPVQVMAREGERMLGKLPPAALLVLCDPGGDAMDSTEFALWLQGCRERAQDLAFVLGGAFGIGAPLRTRPHRRSQARASRSAIGRSSAAFWRLRIAPGLTTRRASLRSQLSSVVDMPALKYGGGG